MMPKDFPPWQTIYDYFSRWNKNGVWERVLDAINQIRRKKLGRKATPSDGIIDASVKTHYVSEDRGIDDGKKVKGHKRHIVVDRLGNLLFVLIHATNLSDTKSACDVMAGAKEKHASIDAFSGDAVYLLISTP